MHWTLLKIVLFVVLVVGLAFGFGQLSDSGHSVGLRLLDMEFELGPIQATLVLLGFIFALWLFLKLAGLLVATLHFINGDETALTRFFMRNREKRGIEAITDALLALAAGDGKQAYARAQKAEKLLAKPALTHLVMAQAHELKGNRLQAKDYYRKLLDNDRSRFVGIKGLVQHKLEEGDRETAGKLAQKALELKPDNAAMQDTLLTLQNQSGDWSGARRTLLQKTRSGTMPRDVYRRRDAVLALQEAQAMDAEGRTARMHASAIEANRLSPDLIPAAVLAARALTAENKHRYATKVIKKAWAVQPHPELAAAFAAIEADETPRQRLARFEKLLKLLPDHPESRMVRAELLIAAEDFPAARRALGDLVETRATSRVLTIMAAIERGEGSEDAVVRGWLTRAITAPRGEQWICSRCQHAHSRWVAICENCESFDTLAWTEAPGQVNTPSATGTEMLPLIVGTGMRKADAGKRAAGDTATGTSDDSRGASVEDAELVDGNTSENATKK